jgi:hypothetical protein
MRICAVKFVSVICLRNGIGKVRAHIMKNKGTWAEIKAERWNKINDGRNSE